MNPAETIMEFCARRAVAQEPAAAVRLIVELSRREAQLLEEIEALRKNRWLAPVGAEAA